MIITVTPGPGGEAANNLVNANYGGTLPIVYGTAKVPGRVVFKSEPNWGQPDGAGHYVYSNVELAYWDIPDWTANTYIDFAGGSPVPRLNGGKVYVLTKWGTTGGTGPVGTTPGVDEWDGSTQWRYVGPIDDLTGKRHVLSTVGHWRSMRASAVDFAICEAPVTGVIKVTADEKVWFWLNTGSLSSLYDTSWYIPMHHAGLLCAALDGPGEGNVTKAQCPQTTPWGQTPTVVTGTTAQTWMPFNVLTGSSSGTTLFNTVQVRFTNLLTDGGKLPELKFEVQGALISGTSQDCHPVDVLKDLLGRTGISASNVITDVGPDGLAASSFRNYCDAMGFRVSRVCTDRSAVNQYVTDLLDSCNSTIIWSEGKAKAIPWADVATGSFTPATTAVVIDSQELLFEKGNDPVTMTRVPDNEVFNCFPVAFNDRSNGYKENVVEYIDPAHSSQYNVRRGSKKNHNWVTNSTHAIQLSTIKAQRSICQRNSYRFTLGPRWNLLEPMDYISLSEPKLGLVNVLCRITTIEESANGRMDVEAIEAPLGSATSIDVTPQTADGGSSGGGYSTPWNGVGDLSGSVTAMGSDNILSKAKKSLAILDYNRLTSEVTRARGVADALTPPLDYSGYCPYYYDELTTYLGTITPAWNDVTTDSPITGTVWRGYWNHAWSMIDRLRKNITENAQNTGYDALALSSGAFYTSSIAFNSASDAFNAANTAFGLAQNGGGGNNLFRNADFSTGSSGVPTNWQNYNNSSGLEPSTNTLFTTGGPFNGPYFRNAWSVDNTTQKGIYYDLTDMASKVLHDQWYVSSFYARASGTNIGHIMEWQWNNAPTSYTVISDPALTSEWQRYALAVLWASGSTIDTRAFYPSINGLGSQGHLDIACPQMSEGAALGAWAPSYLDNKESAASALAAANLAFNSASNAQSTASAAFTSASTAFDAANVALAQVQYVGGGNMLPNTAFTNDANTDGYPDYWHGGSASGISTKATSSVNIPFKGINSVVITCTAATGRTPIIVNTGSTMVYLPSGSSVAWSSFMSASAGTWCFNDLAVYQTNSTASWITTAEGGAYKTNDGWERLTGTWTATTNSWGQVNYGIYTNVVSQVFAVAAPQLEWGKTATGYAPRVQELLSGTITTTIIADGAITTNKITAGSITTALLSASAITAGTIAAGAIQTVHISASTIQGQHIQAGTISGTYIAATTISGSHIVAGTIQGTHISASTIQGTHISASTIQGTHISASTIKGTHISASTIQGTHISASTIQASHMLVKGGVGGALNSDPGCIDPTAWESGAAALSTFSYYGLNGKVGDGMFKAGTGTIALSNPFSVDTSKTYRFHMWAQDWASNGTTRLRINWFKASGTVASAVRAYDEVAITATAMTDYAWTLFESSASAPSDAGLAKLAVHFNDGGSAGTVWVQDIRCEEVIPATLIVDGAISAQKIAARAISTSDYAYTGTPGTATEVATTGAILRAGQSTSNGSIPAILTSPAGIKIGSTTLDQTWFAKNRTSYTQLYSAGGGALTVNYSSENYASYSWDAVNYRLTVTFNVNHLSSVVWILQNYLNTGTGTKYQLRPYSFGSTSSTVNIVVEMYQETAFNTFTKINWLGTAGCGTHNLVAVSNYIYG